MTHLYHARPSPRDLLEGLGRGTRHRHRRRAPDSQSVIVIISVTVNIIVILRPLSSENVIQPNPPHIPPQDSLETP
jgi:hypothetical protein